METANQRNTAASYTKKVSAVTSKKLKFSKEVLIGIIFSACLCSLIISWMSDGLFFKELLISKAIIGMALVIKILEK